MKHTHISWADHTFNPWIGCSKVAGHSGCVNCYAEALMDGRFAKVKWGKRGSRQLTSDAYWHQPILWDTRAAKAMLPSLGSAAPDRGPRRDQSVGLRPRVFCGSLCDVFEEWDGPMLRDGAPFCWPLTFGAEHLDKRARERLGKPATMSEIRTNLWQLILVTTSLNWLLLTKRPENVLSMVGYRDCNCRGPRSSGGAIKHETTCQVKEAFFPNAWIGASASDNQSITKILPHLRSLRKVAPVVFVSLEPLLAPCSDFLELLVKDCPRCHRQERYRWSAEFCNGCGARLVRVIDWLILGGESGRGFRKCPVAELERIANLCAQADLPVWVKQDSGLVPGKRGRISEIVWQMKELPMRHL